MAQAAAQETQMSITIQPASSIISHGEIVYPTQSESHQFQADEGGTFHFVNADGNSVNIIFFIGTTQVTLDFFIDSYDKSAVIAGRPLPMGRDVVGGLIYDMRTFENISETMTFDNPFSMTVGYSETQIGNLDEDSLNIYFWNENGNTWETFATSTLNTIDNTITILSNHLTLFATLGEAKETAPTTITATVAPTVSGGGWSAGAGIITNIQKSKSSEQPAEESLKILEPIGERLESITEKKETESLKVPSSEAPNMPVKNILPKSKTKEVKKSEAMSPIINNSLIRPTQAKEIADEEKIQRALFDIESQLDKETLPKEQDNTLIIICASIGAVAVLVGIYILRKR